MALPKTSTTTIGADEDWAERCKVRLHSGSFDEVIHMRSPTTYDFAKTNPYIHENANDFTQGIELVQENDDK